MIVNTKEKEAEKLVELCEKDLDLVAQAPKDIRAAADHIDLYGHGKHRYFAGENYQSPCCILGSLQAVKANYIAYDVMFRFIGVQSLTTWNDAEERTKEKVTTAMRQAADWVEEVFKGKI